MNVRLVPPYFCVLGDTAFFVEGYTGDTWFDWVLIEAPLVKGRPDMNRAKEVDPNRDWTDTPWEGKAVNEEDILNLVYWVGNLQRSFACIPTVFS